MITNPLSAGDREDQEREFRGIAIALAWRMRSREQTRLALLVVAAAFFLLGSFFVIEEHKPHPLVVFPYVLGMVALLGFVFGFPRSR